MKRALLPLLLASIASAQTPASATSDDAAAVRALWTRYLASKGGRFYQNAGAPSTDWVERERHKWRMYDLAGVYLPDNAAVESIAIEPYAGARGPEYRIVTRLRAEASSTPSITVIVYATRDGGQWRLSNALPRHTRDWKRETVGPITYIYPSNYRFSRARGQRAVAFSDSIAAMFGVPKLGPLDYYLAHSIDDAFAIMGVEYSVKYGATGGLAQPVNRMLFSGIPDVGEEYRHELAHLMLAPLCCTRTNYFVDEGVATWLGGTTGMDLPTATRALARFVAENPAVTLDSVDRSARFSQPQRYTAMAVLVAMVHEAGGVAAVKEFYLSGRSPDEWRDYLERRLGRPWPEIRDAWRRRLVGR